MKLLKLARIALSLVIVLTAVTFAVPALAQEPFDRRRHTVL